MQVLSKKWCLMKNPPSIKISTSDPNLDQAIPKIMSTPGLAEQVVNNTVLKNNSKIKEH